MNRIPDEPDDDVLAELSPERLAELDGPPERWLAELTLDALPPVVVPREAMWMAIQRQRGRVQLDADVAGEAAAVVAADKAGSGAPVRSLSAHRARRAWPTLTTLVGIAATLVAGVAIGRYVMPRQAVTPSPVAEATRGASRADAATLNALANRTLGVAVAEHLVRSEALLTTVRFDNPDQNSAPAITTWARDLLSTTRLLLDDPSLRDAKTRHLLEDLELVLVQVVQARGSSAPLVRGAPVETLRETNLLPRLRATSSASPMTDSYTYSRGITE